MFCTIKSGCPSIFCSFSVFAPIVHRLRLLYIMFNIQMLSRKYIFAQLQCATTVYFFFFLCSTQSYANISYSAILFFLFLLVWHFAQGKMNNKKSKKTRSLRGKWGKGKKTTCTHTQFSQMFISWINFA